MTALLTSLDPAGVVAAIEESFRAVYDLWALMPKSRLVAANGMVHFHTGLPHPMANVILSTRLPMDDADGAVSALCRWYQANSPSYGWVIGPSDSPTDLDGLLIANGMTLGASLPGMAIDLCTARLKTRSVRGITLQEVGDETAVKDIIAVMEHGYGLDRSVAEFAAKGCCAGGFGPNAPIRTIVAYHRGEPVGCASCTGAAGVAGIYCVAVVPKHRDKGIGTLVTKAALQMGADMGLSIGILQASSMGQPIYERIGFTEFCRIGFYVWSRETNREAISLDTR